MIYLAILGDLQSVYLIIEYELLSNTALPPYGARLTMGVLAMSRMTLGVSTITFLFFSYFFVLDLAE